MKDASFYQYALTVRGSNDEKGQLAELIYEDLSFPKYTQDFNELSEHIETHGQYTIPMSYFDDLYEDYQNWLEF
ncbi:YozE family protein [Staphylococcus sp. 11261D007BR]